MKTISELRLEGDARVSIHDMNRFEAAILGGRGDLDAWLECNNEEEVRLHIGKLLHLCVADLQHENQSLRTKIEAMEQQVPYCWTTSPPSGHYSRFNPEVDRWIENGWTVAPLYLAPGAQAQPAPSVPEGWQLVPTAESRHPGIYKMLGALHAADNTPGMSEWESYREMLAAAPEAKP